jgi:hypothetical protein
LAGHVPLSAATVPGHRIHCDRIGDIPWNATPGLSRRDTAAKLKKRSWSTRIFKWEFTPKLGDTSTHLLVTDMIVIFMCSLLLSN